jgi:hypothetical protein
MITIGTFTLKIKGCYHHMISTRLNNTENRSAILENILYLIFFYLSQHPPLGHDLIHEVSRSHTTTHHNQ